MSSGDLHGQSHCRDDGNRIPRNGGETSVLPIAHEHTNLLDLVRCASQPSGFIKFPGSVWHLFLKFADASADLWFMPTEPIIIIIGGGESFFAWLFGDAE